MWADHGWSNAEWAIWEPLFPPQRGRRGQPADLTRAVRALGRRCRPRCTPLIARPRSGLPALSGRDRTDELRERLPQYPYGAALSSRKRDRDVDRFARGRAQTWGGPVREVRPGDTVWI